MMKDLAAWLCALAVAILWSGILAPIIARAFGVPMRGGFWRLDRKNSHLTTWQYVWWFGALNIGVGMSLFFALGDALQWFLLREFGKAELSNRIVGASIAVPLAVILSWIFRPQKGGA